MSASEHDDILAALARLPAPIQHPDARAATLSLALRTLAAAPSAVAPHREAGEPTGTRQGGRGARRPGGAWFPGWWRPGDRLLPALLCLAGALYVRGALAQLTLLFGQAPPAPAVSMTVSGARQSRPQAVSVVAAAAGSRSVAGTRFNRPPRL